MKDIIFRFEELCELKYSGSTPKNYASLVGKFLVWLGNTNPTKEDVLNYNIHIRYKSFSFRNTSLSAIKAFFLLYLQTPLEGIANIRPPKEKKKPVVYDCLDMAERIRSIHNSKHKAILALALCCWLRKSELLNLRIKDINGSLRQVHIHNSKGCKDRVVPVSENVLQILREYFKEYRPTEYIFNGQNGLKYSPTSVDKITKRYLYPKMRFHSIRASGATFAVANGTDIKTVSKILGHSKIQTTEHYIPILYENIKTAI